MEKNHLTITVHMIVRNEEQWVWYAIQSVLPYVEKLLIYDTGSTDKTLSLIQSIKSPKIHLNRKDKVTPKQLVVFRNEQLDKTKTEWFMLLDGDEVWTHEAIVEAASLVTKIPFFVTALVSPTLVPIGDLSHFQSDKAGRYNIQGRHGHFNIRIYRKRKDYHWQGIYPLEAYVDGTETPVQSKKNEIEFLSKPYWHMTHLIRSNVDTHHKRKLEIGQKREVKLPEVFNLERPLIVPSPQVHLSKSERLLACIYTPLLQLKRAVFP